MVRSLRLFLLSSCLLAAGAPAAHAGWFPAETIDGPGADVMELGDVDIARDGTGAVAYIKADAGVPHVFISRKVNGAWRAPERVDVGVETAASQPTVAAAAGHRLLVAWISAGRLYGSVVAGGGTAGPVAAPTLLFADPDPLRAARTPHADMGINGTGYIVYTAPGGGGSDVRAVRLTGTGFQGVDPPLDIQSDQAAGAENARPRVAVSAEGNAVATWGEDHQDGRSRIYGRRITGVSLSLAPQEVSLPDFEGAAGGDADSPDIEVEDDGSYAWVVFRQDLGSASRVLARRLVGSLFEAPAAIEGTGFGETPRIGMTGRGVGFAVAGIRGQNGLQGAFLLQDVFGAPMPVAGPGSDRQPLPVVGTSEKDQVAVAWRGAEGAVWARHKPYKEPFEADARLTDPALGVAADSGLEITEDRQGNFAVAFLQGGVMDRRLMVAEYDRIPGVPVPTSTTNNQNRSKPIFQWRAGLELWGEVTFRVIVDGEELGRTTKSSLRSPRILDDGPHRWRVIAVDRRGQETPARERTIRIDKSLPDVALRLTGKKKAGALLKYRITADDFGGSGIKTVLVDWGDRSPISYVLRGVKRFRSGKVYRVRLKAVDKAGNVRQKFVRVRIKK